MIIHYPGLFQHFPWHDRVLLREPLPARNFMAALFINELYRHNPIFYVMLFNENWPQFLGNGSLMFPVTGDSPHLHGLFIK